MSSNTAHSGDKKVAEFISSAGNESVDKGTQKYTHKYKWRGEEITILTILYGLAVGFGVWAVMNNMAVGYFIAGGVAAVLAIAVTNLGASRKRKSRLFATYDPETTELSVEGNGLDAAQNHVKLSEAKTVYTKKITRNDDVYDPRDYLVVSKEGAKHVKIPMRLVSRAGLLELLTETASKVNSKEDPKVSALLEAAKDYR